MQKKSLRIIYFQNRNAHTSPLFRELNILKLPDKIAIEKCLFINKYFKKCLSTIFENWFSLSSDFHTYDTRWSNLGCVVVPPHNTKLYGRSSVNISTVYIWNYLQKLFINFFIFLSIQLIVTQLIVIHATSDSPILGFTPFT